MDSNMFRLDRNGIADTATYSLSFGRTYTVVASGSFTAGSPLGFFASYYNGVDANLGN